MSGTWGPGRTMLMLAVCSLPAVCNAADKTREAAFATHLEQLLQDGLHGRFNSSSVNRHAAAARRLRPDDPAVEYAAGLVMLKRIRIPQAVRQLQAAVRKSPSYLPAWKVLLRTRLAQKDAKSLRKESARLADAVVNQRTRWTQPAERNEAAELLGRVVGFLELPDVDLLPAGELREFDADLQRRLGAGFRSSYERGKSGLLADFKKLQAEVERDVLKQSLKQRRETGDKLSEIEKKQAAAKSKKEKLERTAAQWKSRLGEQTAAAKKQLGELKKDYLALQTADARVARLATQTTIDIGKLRTELALRGIRGRLADMQPVMLRLQQESTRYTTQRLALQQRAARVRLQVARVITGYTAATREYQKATGRIVSQDASVKTWQKLLAKTSANINSKTPSKRTAVRLKAQLKEVASYFELDFEAEAQRLLKQYRPEPAASRGNR